MSNILTSARFCYPADVLALRSWREGLGADDGVPSHKRVLLANIWPTLFGPNDRAVLGRWQAVHTRLLVHLDEECDIGKI